METKPKPGRIPSHKCQRIQRAAPQHQVISVSKSGASDTVTAARAGSKRRVPIDPRLVPGGPRLVRLLLSYSSSARIATTSTSPSLLLTRERGRRSCAVPPVTRRRGSMLNRMGISRLTPLPVDARENGSRNSAAVRKTPDSLVMGHRLLINQIVTPP